ncbi:MAG: hypothetical protein WA057_01505 [Candidatus Magasanikiibacteriota bacterium]
MDCIITHAELEELRATAEQAKKRRRILGHYTEQQMSEIVRRRSFTVAVLAQENGNHGCPQLYE